jgi:hypothetical protein
MECVKTAIIQRVEPREPLHVITQTEFYMPRVCARTVIFQSTTNKKEIQRKLLSKMLAQSTKHLSTRASENLLET